MKSMRNISLIIMLSSLLILAATVTVCTGATPIGKVTDIEGNAKSKTPKGVESLLKKDSSIHLADRVVTEKNGKVGITFNDNTYLAIGPSSDMIIDTYVYSPKDKPGVFNINALKGIFLLVAGKMERKRMNRFTVHTATAVVGVKGTSFAVLYDISDDMEDRFNRTKKSPKGITVSSENFYSINFAGNTYVANSQGRVELEGPCPYCVVAPKKLAKLAFLDMPLGKGVVLSDSGGKRLLDPQPGKTMLAEAGDGLPQQGSKPHTKCNIDAAAQFSDFFTDLFGDFPNTSTSWVTPFVNERSQENDNPAAPEVQQSSAGAEGGKSDEGNGGNGY